MIHEIKIKGNFDSNEVDLIRTTLNDLGYNLDIETQDDKITFVEFQT